MRISIHLMFLFIATWSAYGDSIPIFQYISCSYLSEVHVTVLSTVVLFQYISCSYLSISEVCCLKREKHFNTSHVLIYRIILFRIPLITRYFNTSHVLIYPKLSIAFGDVLYISIHLMFLFITTEGFVNEGYLEFQYISCSYLSNITPLLIAIPTLFQYISCSYLSLNKKRSGSSNMKFQYISCSYLSIHTGRQKHMLKTFQYISCSYLS